MNIVRIISVLITLAMLSACQVQPVKEQKNQMAEPVTHKLSEKLKRDLFSVDQNTLSNILIGEWYGQKKNFEQAGVYYSEAGMVATDPAVIRRAVIIASYNSDWDQVRNLAEHWSDIEPEDVRPLEFMLLADLKMQDFVSAQLDVDRMLKMPSFNDSEAWERVTLAVAKSATGEQTDRLLKQLLEHAPVQARADIMIVQSQMAYKQKDYELAEHKAKQALELSPQDKDIYLWLAQLSKKSGDMFAVIANQKKALALVPDDEKLRIAVAQQIRLNGDELAAAELLLEGKQTAQIMALAGMMLADKDRAKAEKLYRRLLKVAKTSREKYQAGIFSEILGHDEKAISFYHQVRSVDERAEAALREVVVLDRLGRIDAARYILQSMRRWQEADWPQTYLFEADMLSRAKRYQESFDILSRGLGLEPGNTDLRYSHALLAEKIGRIDVLEGDLRAILKEKPEDADALNALGYTLADHGKRLGEAYTYISTALRINPQSSAILDSMGWVLFRQGRFKEAVVYLQRALNAGFDAEVALHLLEVLNALERNNDAQNLVDEMVKQSGLSEKIKQKIKEMGYELNSL
ncbi:MAG: tetratricopeptide repeat protein [bacterium]